MAEEARPKIVFLFLCNFVTNLKSKAALRYFVGINLKTETNEKTNTFYLRSLNYFKTNKIIELTYN